MNVSIPTVVASAILLCVAASCTTPMVLTESSGHAFYPQLNVELDYTAQLRRSSEAPPPGIEMWLQLEQSSLYVTHDDYALITMQSADGEWIRELELSRPAMTPGLEDPLSNAVVDAVAALVANAAEGGIAEDDPMYRVIEKLKDGEWVDVSAATSRRELLGRVRLLLAEK